MKTNAKFIGKTPKFCHHTSSPRFKTRCGQLEAQVLIEFAIRPSYSDSSPTDPWMASVFWANCLKHDFRTLPKRRKLNNSSAKLRKKQTRAEIKARHLSINIMNKTGHLTRQTGLPDLFRSKYSASLFQRWQCFFDKLVIVDKVAFSQLANIFETTCFCSLSCIDTYTYLRVDPSCM